jgi:hypothetical protein
MDNEFHNSLEGDVDLVIQPIYDIKGQFDRIACLPG